MSDCRTWLLVDVPFLCNRAFYALPGLEKDGVKTQVVYGVLSDIGNLMFEFKTTDVCLCFDSKQSVRRDMYPEYKQKRRDDRTPEEEEARHELYDQITKLRRKYFPAIGFRNVFMQRGYESDDLMAELARTLPGQDEVYIVTADHDMFQCIRRNVRVYDPMRKSFMTEGRLMKEYGVTPEQWALVKEIGGCKSDNVPAVADRVGETTALSWVKGELKEGSKKLLKIDAAPLEIRKRNRRLVKLPFKGTEPIEPVAGATLSEEGWFEVCDELGFGAAMRTGRNNPFVVFTDTESKRRRRGEFTNNCAY